MKFTLLLTQQCNLDCRYCYIDKRQQVISSETIGQAVDFIYAQTPSGEEMQIGFFGGEPLLAFDRLQELVQAIESHSRFDRSRVLMTVVTNGTIFTPEIADFFREHDIGFGISCDGPAALQDRFRRFPDGRGTSHLVERTIRGALDAFQLVLVNAVYGPETVAHLPEVIDYLSGLGVRQIYLNPDISAAWQSEDVRVMQRAYSAVAKKYEQFYLEDRPHFISLIDSKISVILRQGYAAEEKCRMGRQEMAVGTDGTIYPCERLVGDGSERNSIGSLDAGLDLSRMACSQYTSLQTNLECGGCSLSDYCMHWCGCTNFHGTGYFNRVSPFICASEKAAITEAYELLRNPSILRRKGVFCDHAGGLQLANSSRLL